MTYKTILLHVNNSKPCESRIDVAAALAKDYDAHLIGLYINYIPYIQGYGFDPTIPVMEYFPQEELEADARKARELFDNRVRRLETISTEWRSANGYLDYATSLHARYADLVVVGQYDPSDVATPPFTPHDFPAGIALAAARPVLVIPYAGTFTTIGRNIVVAWNGSREATRAITDAMPFLQRADKVTVLVANPIIGPMQHGEVPGADLALYLARHGVKAEVTYQEKVEGDVGEWLLSRVADVGADLIVMGVYGHVRLRELVLGGVTRTVMGEMTVPVLISH